LLASLPDFDPTGTMYELAGQDIMDAQGNILRS